ncbi:alpha/beta hydrolase [Xanthobacter sp. DSM 24535]|uniref:dienelactone hydrolase family protein n=1 Tax=Roseixanthobacter psychrophilus TaxID=3119917 RepID=UPI00372C9AB4
MAAGLERRHSREIFIGPVHLAGDLWLPEAVRSLVVFAHGSGSSRLSSRNRAVAEALNRRGMATLLFDLLTADEEADRANVFDISLLAGRLADAVHWIDVRPDLSALPLGLFGASTGAAAALVAAAQLRTRIGAIVSRGGRPDLAGPLLPQVRAPTLLIVGGADREVLELNRQALAQLAGPKALRIVPGATHLFPETGAMDTVIALAADWFGTYLAAPAPDAA